MVLKYITNTVIQNQMYKQKFLFLLVQCRNNEEMIETKRQFRRTYESDANEIEKNKLNSWEFHILDFEMRNPALRNLQQYDNLTDLWVLPKVL